MRKQNNIKLQWTALLFALIALSACSEKLSIDPQDRVNPSTVDDYQDILVGGLPGVYHAFTELMTDNTVAKDYPSYNSTSVYTEWSKAYLWIDQSFTEEPTAPEYAWRWYYADIYKANQVIQNVLTAEGDSALAYHVYGEALAARAYSHFMLVNLFAQHYDSTSAQTDLGVPLALEPQDAGFYSFSRNTVQEVYEQIDADLEEAAKYVKDSYFVNPIYHFNRLAIKALQARIALYKGENEKAVNLCTEILTENSNIIDHNDFADIAGGETFEPLVHANNYFTTETPGILMLRSGYFALNYLSSGYYANEFKEIYENRDLRASHNFTYTNAAAKNYITLKLSLSYEQYNYPLFRVEEVLLNRAEACAKLGDDDSFVQAIRDLNSLRVKRFHPDYYDSYIYTDFKSSEELLEEVLLERQKEMCYEGHRWFDLKRNGAPEITHTFNGEEYVLEENDLRYVLQIPDHELNNNPSMEANPR